MVFFFRNNYLHANEYSITIFLAGLTMAPLILGPAGVILVILALSLNLELIKGWNNVNEFHPAFIKLLDESNRHQIVDPNARFKFTGIADLSKLSKEEDLKAARAAFNEIDTNKSGFIDQHEIVELTRNWNITPTVLTFLLSTMKKNKNQLAFEQFYRHVWHISDINKPLKPPSSVTSDIEKAKLVFDTLDIDSSGNIDVGELASLLVQWGCPDSEVSSYLRNYDTNNDGVFDFDEFYIHFKPVWRFGYYILCRDELRAKKIADAEALCKKDN